MKKIFRVLTVGAAAALAATLVAPPANSAEGDDYSFRGYAGGTQVSAIGTTVTSDLTAESSIVGMLPASRSNKVASVRLGTLGRVGAVETDTTAVKKGDGFEVTSHARTAGVNLLNGLIKITAVETTTVTTSDGTTTPTADSQTELVGLTIAGKKYPITVPPNTGINIPGVVSIMVNASTSAVKDDSVVSMGAGLVVTLLKTTGGVAAGGQIMLNPTYAAVQPATRSDGGAVLGGLGYGAYVQAHVGTEIEAETGMLGLKPMPMVGTDGSTLSNTTARVNVPGVLRVSGIESTVKGVSTPAVSESTVTSKLADLRLFPTLLGALISADAIGSVSHARVTDDGSTVDGSFQFVNLKIAGKSIPIDVAPNTSIHIANLGTVTLNEQTPVVRDGMVHAYQVIGLHLVLDTARAGLPVGAEIQVGVSQAIVWK